MKYQPGIVHNTLFALHAPAIARARGTITCRPAVYGHACAIARALPGAVITGNPAQGFVVTVKTIR